MPEIRVEGVLGLVRVGSREVVQHALAARGVTHEHQLIPAVAAELGLLVLFDVPRAGGDLVGVTVEVAEAPGLAGGGEVEGEEGPFRLFQGADEVDCVGRGGQAVA